MNKNLRGVCVGAGYFSRYHFDAWRRIPGVEIVGCSDLDAERLAKIVTIEGIPRGEVDYRVLFDELQPDFVDIITPPPTHLEVATEAASRGIHVLCQKPLAPTFEEACELVRRVKGSGVRLMVNENFRFQPWYREIKRRLDQGALGDRLFSMTFRMRMGDGWGADAYLGRQPYFREYPRLLIYETGVHFIDTFRYLAGEIRSVQSWLRRLNPVIQGEDCGVVVFEFETGAMGIWDANRYNEPASNVVEARYTFGEFLVEGSGGSLRLAQDGALTLQCLGQVGQALPYEPSREGFAGDCCRETHQHFVDCLRSGAAFETDGTEYLKTLAVQEAIYLSNLKRRPVALVEVQQNGVQPWS